MRTLISITAAVVLAASIAVARPAAQAKPKRPAATQSKSVRPAAPVVKELRATSTTVAYGYYDASAPPVMRVQSGDTIRVHTLITSTPQRLEAAGVPSAEIEPALREIVEKVTTNKGPGGHILTGPIFVEGAEPGDVLEVRIRDVRLAIPYAYNGFSPRGGFLPQDFAESRTKIIRLDAKRMIGRFAQGIEIPLHPFFGSMGVAPPPAAGRLGSAPPGRHAGNLDNKELVAGSTLYIPVHAPGALFEVGDGHAAQGDGEVDITALETSLVGTFQLIVRKDLHLAWPRAETPTEWITMGIDDDLTEAARIATREMIDLLATTKQMSREDAYMLMSAAGDLAVTQVVDGPRGVHAKMAKGIFTKK